MFYKQSILLYKKSWKNLFKNLIDPLTIEIIKIVIINNPYISRKISDFNFSSFFFIYNFLKLAKKKINKKQRNAIKRSKILI